MEAEQGGRREVSLLSCWVGCSGVPLCFHCLPHPHQVLRSLGGHPEALPGLAQLLAQDTCAGAGRLQRRKHRAPAGKQCLSFGVSLCCGRQQCWQKKMIFQLNVQPWKVFSSVVTMLRVHLFCILAGFTLIKVRPTCEYSFSSSYPQRKILREKLA